MNYSRRQLYAFGEPIGESATRLKLGGRIYGGGGDSGGGAAPPDKTTQITELPEWARPYAKDTLAKGAALTDINQNPYQQYTGQRIAGFSPMQQRSMQAAANMRPSEQLGTATDLASAAGMSALGINYQPSQFSNQFQAPASYQPSQFTMERAAAPSLQNYQMTGPTNVASEKFGQQAATDYMSPYMQSVVGVQQREAQRQSDIAGTQRNAQAAQAGAFGGSRQAIMNAEAARNLATQKGDIQAQGLQSAYGQAQQQFNADQAQRMQAALANQGMGYNVGAQNLQANLGVQQLGAGQNLQAQLANQGVNQQIQQAREQSKQFGAGLDMTSAQQKAQYGQAAQQLGEQSKQFGANLGLQGLQTSLSAAGQLGQLGGQQFQQGMDINKLQNVYGGQNQQQAQRYLDQDYQDFQNQQNYPYKQLGFMSDMIRGLPLGQQSTSTMYSQGPGTVQTLAGLGGAAYGFGKSGMFGKEGGLMTSYAEGGGVTSQANKDSIVEDMYSMEGLKKAKQAALARRDIDTAEAIDERIAELNAIQAQSASLDRGLGSAFDQIPEEQQETMMAANGGIVAFAGGGTYGKRFEQSLTDLKAMANKGPVEPTPEQRDEAISTRIPMLEKRYGPDITQPYLEETKAKRAKLPEQMEKDQGLAFAMASLGLLARSKKPGESQKQQLLSGLGEAGQSFIGEVGKLKKENREVDDKLRQSEILLATAQQSRKEGLINKADAEETRAQDLKRDAFKTNLGVQEKVAQLEGGLAGTEMQGANALKVAGLQAATQREIANKPGEFERMLSDYEKRVGRKLSPEEFKQAMTEIGAARYGARYTGPDKTFENDAKFQKDLTDRTKMLQLQKVMPGKTPEEIEALDMQIERERLGLIEEYRQTRASGVTSKAAPGAPAPGKSVADVGRTPDPEAVNILKSAPSTRNRKYFDDVYGAGAAARVLGN
jgi:hypothetical protein